MNFYFLNLFLISLFCYCINKKSEDEINESDEYINELSQNTKDPNNKNFIINSQNLDKIVINIGPILTYEDLKNNAKIASLTPTQSKKILKNILKYKKYLDKNILKKLEDKSLSLTKKENLINIAPFNFNANIPNIKLSDDINKIITYIDFKKYLLTIDKASIPKEYKDILDNIINNNNINVTGEYNKFIPPLLNLISNDKSHKFIQLIQKAHDLRLGNLNFEFTDPTSPKKEKTSIIESLLSKIIQGVPTNNIDTLSNEFIALEYFLQKNKFFFDKNQKKRINKIIKKNIENVAKVYNHLIECINIFEKYLNNTLLVEELTDYKNFNITIDDIDKIVISTSTNEDIITVKQDLKSIFHNNKSIKKYELFNYIYISELKNYNLDTDKDIYDLKTKFIKYLLKHKCFSESKIKDINDPLHIFSHLITFIIDTSPNDTQSMKFNKETIKAICKTKYLNPHLKKVFQNIKQKLFKNVNELKMTSSKLIGMKNMILNN